MTYGQNRGHGTADFDEPFAPIAATDRCSERCAKRMVSMAADPIDVRPRRWGSLFPCDELASIRTAIENEIVTRTAGKDRSGWP
jgi:hypothetical protein